MECDFDLITEVRQLALRLEDVVGRVILVRLRALAVDAVRLHAQRIHAEDERAPLVVERLDEQLYKIVAEIFVTIGQRGVDRAVRLECANAEINFVIGIPHEHFRRVLGRRAVHRRVLREAGQDCRVAPGGLVQRAIDFDFSGDLRSHDRGLRRPAIVYALHGRDRLNGCQLQDRDKCENHGLFRIKDARNLARPPRSK